MTNNDENDACPKPAIALTPWPAPLRFLDASFRKPAENLAYDDLLLDDAEAGNGADTLRIWESPVPFVVLGVSQVLREHVNEEACEEDRIPILRRCSAGGCVLQGPGCINYTLVLSHKHFTDIGTIRGSYCFILNRLAAALREKGVTASHKGISDLAVGGKKVSGNAQRRRKGHILHHGTLLYSMDPEMMERYLLEPADRPQYRGVRTHRGFVKTIPLAADDIREVFRRAFGEPKKSERPTAGEVHAVIDLAKEKYQSKAWTHRR